MSAVRGFVPLLLVAAAAAFAQSAPPPPRLTGASVETVNGLTPARAIATSGREPVWIGWAATPVAGAERICCGGWRDGARESCSLAEEDHGWNSTDDGPVPTRLYVFLEAAHGEVLRIKPFSGDCAVDGAGRRVLWLGDADASASLDALEPLLAAGAAAGEDVAERSLAMIAYHADPRADRILEGRVADRSLESEAREQALFWSGNLRGEAGYRLLDRVLAARGAEADEDLRRHATFVLTLNSDPRAIERLKRAAAEDSDSEVRAQALFWLAQSDTPGAGEWILERMAREEDEHVREQAVFALSRLDDGADRLLELMRTSRDPEVVRQALFWLGQSDDPRALAELERILAR